MIDFIPAVYRENKHKCYVEYYALHPSQNILKRKQIRVDRIKGKKEKKRFAKRLAQRINLKLEEGWNPFIEQESPRALHRFSDAIEEFLLDKRSLRKDTLRGYNSNIKLLKNWLTDNFEQDDPMILNFDYLHAAKFMEAQFRRNISNLRYNNILVFQRLLFNWMKEHYYTKVNPFEMIKKKKATNKQRIMDIEPEMRKKIRNYLRTKNNWFWCVCMFAFHSLIRPKEISFIRIKDIDLANQTVKIPGNIAKNGNDRYCTIPDVMIEDIKLLMRNAKRKNHYLFSKHFLPGPDHWDSREIARYWSQLRKAINLPMEVQFYSLRDAGIIQKLRDGLDPATVMELADHSSLEVTNKYVKIARQKANIEAKTRSTAF